MRKPNVKRVARVGRYAGVGCGLTLLAITVHGFGLERALICFRSAGWWLVPLLCVSAVWKGWNTLAWIVALPTGTQRPGFLRMFRVSLGGDVLNGLLPTANVGGELAKPYFLRSEMPVAECTTGVMGSKTMELLAGQIMIVAGVIAALWVLPLSDTVRVSLTLLAMTGLGLIWFGLFAQRKEPLTRLFRLLSRFGVWFEKPQVLDAVARIDSELALFLRFRTRRLWGCLGLRFVSLAFGVLETYLLLKLMGYDDAALPAFLLFSLGMVVDALFFFIPGSLGAMEAGTAFLFAVMGLDPGVGLSMALCKRMRKICWMTIGSVLLYVPGRLGKGGEIQISNLKLKSGLGEEGGGEVMLQS
jgi:glycosyltransferase 2 family protein